MAKAHHKFSVVQLIKAEKDVHKAVTIFDSATAEYSNGFRYDHETFGLMISRLVAVNQYRTAEGMLERMKQENSMVTKDTLQVRFVFSYIL